MKNHSLFSRLAVYAIATLLITSCAALGKRQVSISDVDIQNKLAEKMREPIKIMKIFNMQLSAPRVTLDANTNRLTTEFNANMSDPFGMSEDKDFKGFNGKVKLSGLPRFDAATGTVLLSSVKIEDFNLGGFGGKFAEMVNALTDSINQQGLSEIPLYTLKPDDLKVGTTTYLPTEFKVNGNQLQVTLQPQ